MAKWSMPEVENAIKAAFFSKAAEGVMPEALRFTELRNVIRESRPISDRTLSKGVKHLVHQDALKRRVDGSYERIVKIERQGKMDIFDFWESMRFEHLDSFAWMFLMEKIAPGAFPRLMEKLLRPPTGVLADIKSGVPIHQSMATRPKEWIPYMAKLFSEDEETVKAEWPKLTIEAEGGVRAFETLRRHLAARDWTLFNKHWSSIVMARYWLCAVVR